MTLLFVLGVVLEATCMHSGMRCLSPNAKWWPTWADVFPNIALMPKIEASTFIMHVRRRYFRGRLLQASPQSCLLMLATCIQPVEQRKPA